jgi:glycosyltransferase involved in cell wall biosynthesis
LSTVREIVDHGKNGHLIPAGSAEKLAEGINKLLIDNQYRISLAKAGFETARNFSWVKRGIRLNEFLEQIS